jgi:GNAT superfamily N-acetyltransferase
MEISIRSVQIADAADVARLSAQFGYPAVETDVRAWLSLLLDSKADWVWVAMGDGRILAWIQATAMFRMESGKFLEITGLVVDESVRSLGIGGRMVLHVKEFGKASGFERLVVRSNISRIRAHQFYLKLGFAERKQQKVFEIALQSDAKT